MLKLRKGTGGLQPVHDQQHAIDALRLQRETSDLREQVSENSSTLKAVKLENQ